MKTVLIITVMIVIGLYMLGTSGAITIGKGVTKHKHNVEQILNETK